VIGSGRGSVHSAIISAVQTKSVLVKGARMDFEEIKTKIEEHFKKQNLIVQFGEGDDYENAVAFRIIDKNKKVVLPEHKMPISRISEKATLDNYLSWLENQISAKRGQTERQLVTEKELIEILNNELHKRVDSKYYNFTSVLRLRDKDESGCNWSSSNVGLGASGVPAELIRGIPERIVAETRKKIISNNRQKVTTPKV
jgi:hypothetical protein